LQEAQYLRQQGALHSLVDISDGLSSDLTHIAVASGVSAELEAEAIPMHDEVRQVAQALQGDALHYALHGGEDFELCLTAPPGRVEGLRTEFAQRFQCGLVRVGTVQPGSGVRLVMADGSQIALSARGYDHFQSSGSL
jgi:thiamine-monophosphate kinase